MAVEDLNLASPPGFRGLHPDLPITLYRRHLPHWRQKGATYFVTFRLADALPQAKLRELKRWREEWENRHLGPRNEQHWEEFARQHSALVERWIDEGLGECVFASADIANVMAEALLYFQNERYMAFSYVVMPNHCHVAVKPLSDWKLEQILDSWKGYVGHQVNRRLGREGPLWQEESYDRIIRDDEHLYRVIQYIGNNPRNANLPRSAWFRWIHPEWNQNGWGFRDP